VAIEQLRHDARLGLPADADALGVAAACYAVLKLDTCILTEATGEEPELDELLWSPSKLLAQPWARAHVARLLLREWPAVRSGAISQRAPSCASAAEMQSSDAAWDRGYDHLEWVSKRAAARGAPSERILRGTLKAYEEAYYWP